MIKNKTKQNPHKPKTKANKGDRKAEGNKTRKCEKN